MRLLATGVERRGAALALALVLAACAGRTPAPVTPGPAASAARPGAVKIGKPYQVFGRWYYPADDRGYDMRGLASWYGPGFHAASTANGETYDQDGLTAAHKTLPMPSWVEVENLDNGRMLVVRINDRGPFVDGRIIDLSRRSAQLLGVDGPGTARVRVRRVFPAGMPPAPKPLPPVVVAAAPAAPIAAAIPAVTTVAMPASSAAPLAGGRFVQVAALGDPGRLAWLTGYLGVFGPVVSQRAPSGLTRVRLGPYADPAAANAALAQVRAAGYAEARIVTPTTP